MRYSATFRTSIVVVSALASITNSASVGTLTAGTGAGCKMTYLYLRITNPKAEVMCIYNHAKVYVDKAGNKICVVSGCDSGAKSTHADESKLIKIDPKDANGEKVCNDKGGSVWTDKADTKLCMIPN